MPSLPENPPLAEVARQLSTTGWAVALCDARWRLVWVSQDLKVLLGETDEAKVGYGRHILECFLSPTWADTITEDSRLAQFLDHGPMFMADSGKEAVTDILRVSAEVKGFSSQESSAFAEVLAAMEPETPPLVHASKFDYVQGELPPFPVSLIVVRLHDERGELLGIVMLYSSALPARVLALVARGDEGLFTRMARLVAPGRRQASILFTDMQDSAVMSRRLPTGAYFKLIRALTTAMDKIVIDHHGVVGKHAGDGVSAFFLADDLGSSSAAARAAISAARAVADAAGTAAKEVADETGLIDPTECLVNVGVHWGGTLYMGQLVTGGRLEVTALGDAVNECARIQESARDGASLASKPLIEHLSDEDARALGLDPDGVVYRTVAELPAASEKAIRDAGSIPVTVL
jgi:class 3 adenylate cyclase